MCRGKGRETEARQGTGTVDGEWTPQRMREAAGGTRGENEVSRKGEVWRRTMFGHEIRRPAGPLDANGEGGQRGVQAGERTHRGKGPKRRQGVRLPRPRVGGGGTAGADATQTRRNLHHDVCPSTPSMRGNPPPHRAGL